MSDAEPIQQKNSPDGSVLEGKKAESAQPESPDAGQKLVSWVLSNGGVSWVLSNGGLDAEKAPEEYKSILTAKKWGKVEDVLKGYKELESFVGQKVLKQFPDIQLTEELEQKIYEKLGVPSSPDAYDFTPPEKPPVEIDENLVSEFKKFAHGLKLTPKQFQELINFQLEVAGAAQEAMQKQLEEQRESAAKELKAKWKSEYEENFKRAKQTAEKFGILPVLEEVGLADHPKVIDMLFTMSSRLAEDKIQTGAGTAPAKEQTLYEQLSELFNSEAYKNKLHPEHQKAVEKYLTLIRESGK